MMRFSMFMMSVLIRSTGTARSGRESEREAVHAIAQAGRFGTVVEYMPQMAAAAPAQYFVARHAERLVGPRDDRVIQRLPETRPAGAAIELRFLREQRQRATGAREGAGAVFVV
jgi:hypothetical protein